MRKPTELLSDYRASREIRRLNRDPESSRHFVTALDEPQTLRVRQRLAALYVENGTIDPADVDPATGTLRDDKDPQRDALYFGVMRRNPDGTVGNDIIMSARLILDNDGQGLDSFQMSFQELPLKWQIHFATSDPATIGEFSSFIKEPDLSARESKVARAHLIREVIGTARELGVRQLIFGMSPSMVASYRQVFGSAIEPLKHKTISFGKFGAQKVPCLLDTETGYAQFQAEKRHKLGMGAVVAFMGEAFRPLAEVRHDAPLSPSQLPARLRGRLAISRAAAA
jgi:hypothetical protein